MAIVDLGGTIQGASTLLKEAIDRIWPSPTDDAAAKVSILKANTDSIIAQLDAQNRAANAEAASADPWTSRARPSFLYVMYALILASVPMGFLAAIRP